MCGNRAGRAVTVQADASRFVSSHRAPRIVALVGDSTSTTSILESAILTQAASSQATRLEVWPGKAYPLGATYDGSGTNFAVFSEVAEQVELCLFDADGGRGHG